MARDSVALGALWIISMVYSSMFRSSLAVERHYFIAAVEVIWDYAPSGQNLVGLDNE